MFAYVGGITQAAAILDAQVAALAPAQTLKRLLERRELGTPCGGRAREHADTPHSLALLRSRRERPRRRASEQRDELAAFPSMEMHPMPQLGKRTAGYRIAADQSALITRDN